MGNVLLKSKRDKIPFLSHFFSFLKGPSNCKELSSLKPVVPSDIWSASDLDENMSPIIGTTIDFVCPEGLKLSHDNDGFNSFDDKFTILCTTRKTYDIPKEVTDWPSCVKSCPKRLPYIPSLDETGLVRIDAQNTIPAGQSGKYICSDTNLGINRVKIILLTRVSKSFKSTFLFFPFFFLLLTLVKYW